MSLNLASRRALLAAARFSPLQFDGLQGWWRSDTGTTIATGVSAWADQSGNGRSLNQATGAAQPVFSASSGPNGLPGLTFDGSNDILAAVFTLNQPNTSYLLVKQVTWTNGDYLMDGNTHDGLAVYQDTTTPNVSIYAGTILGPSTSLTLGSWGVICALFNGASSVLRINNNTEIAGQAGAANAGGVVIGADGPSGGAAHFSNIVVSDVIVYNTAHTAAQRNAVVAYLMSRGGI